MGQPTFEKPDEDCAWAQEFTLEAQGIYKYFPGVCALNNVRLRIRRGTVHALAGENGAGKSTLMKILLGMYTPDQGRIRYQGKDVVIAGPGQALRMGISMIHQELNPLLDMSVSDNIYLGREVSNPATGYVSRKQMGKQTRRLLDSLGITGIAPNQKLRELSVAQMQMVEIAKAVSCRCALVIMDEPTSSIAEADVQTLFSIITALKKKGIAIIYITHKLDEIFQIADEITVLRDGQYVQTSAIADVDRETLIRLMVGRELQDLYRRTPQKPGEPVLKVERLCLSGLFENISFEARRGEVLGISGLVGSRRTEVVETIFGIRKPTSGRVYKDGQPLSPGRVKSAIGCGMALATEDRKQSGLFLQASIRHNISIVKLRDLCVLWHVNRRQEIELCKEFQSALKIKINTLEQAVSTLSGGNQQKVVLAKWLALAPDILLLDEPTRGIDIGAKAEIYGIIDQLALQGKAVILISSEMPELIGISDRVLVFNTGRIQGELSGETLTQENIMQYAAN